MKIFLTGDSKGIGKALFDDLSQDFQVYGVSRTGQYKYDLTEGLLRLSKDFENIKFDVIILNAGIGDFNSFECGNLEKYEKIISLNLLSNIRLLKSLNYTKNTKIIFIGSIISKKFMKGASVYQASKFGQRGFAGGLKKEGYKTFIINPKIVDTHFHPEEMNLDKFPKTTIESIVKSVKNIINGSEKKFEIDL